jgi:hypothetical protein
MDAVLVGVKIGIRRDVKDRVRETRKGGGAHAKARRIPFVAGEDNVGGPEALAIEDVHSSTIGITLSARSETTVSVATGRGYLIATCGTSSDLGVSRKVHVPGNRMWKLLAHARLTTIRLQHARFFQTVDKEARATSEIYEITRCKWQALVGSSQAIDGRFRFTTERCSGAAISRAEVVRRRGIAIITPGANSTRSGISRQSSSVPHWSWRQRLRSQESGVALLLCGPDGVLRECGVRRQQPDAQISWVSPREEAVDGLSAGLLIGMMVLDLTCDNERAEISRVRNCDEINSAVFPIRCAGRRRFATRRWLIRQLREVRPLGGIAGRSPHAARLGRRQPPNRA